MNKISYLKKLRKKIKSKYSIGSWMQIPNSSIAEILGSLGYDWVTIDMEHGAISIDQLPDLCRAIELGSTLPFVRVSDLNLEESKRILDSGISGLIFPKIETAKSLEKLINACTFPPYGNRGVGYSRANMFGKDLNNYLKKNNNPFIVAMIESIEGVNKLDSILKVKGLDAIFIGPYDLSASMNLTGKFNDKKFKKTISIILNKCKKAKVACGIHIVKPDKSQVKIKIRQGFKFLAYSMDSVILGHGAKYPGKN